MLLAIVSVVLRTKSPIFMDLPLKIRKKDLFRSFFT